MDLEYVFDSPSVKILDTNFFSPIGLSVLRKASQTEELDEIPLDMIDLESSMKLEGCSKLQKQGVFSLYEVGKELKRELTICNGLLKHYFQQPLKYTACHPNTDDHSRTMDNPRKIREVRLSNMLTEKAIKNEKNEAYDHLNDLAKNLVRVIELINKRDALHDFSARQMRQFDNFFHYFVFLAKSYGLEKDYTQRYNPGAVHHPNFFRTDEKILAASFTIAGDRDVSVLSSDSDLKRMINFFSKSNRFKDRFDLPKLRHNVFLYSSLNGDYELVGTA